jgi:hypothetical protein
MPLRSGRHFCFVRFAGRAGGRAAPILRFIYKREHWIRMRSVRRARLARLVGWTVAPERITVSFQIIY